MRQGECNLITDIPGLAVGNAEDHALKSGVTVVTADRPFKAAVHVMGGAPGMRDTALLEPDKLVEDIDAIVLSGGSAFGLDSASGVMQALREKGRGFQLGEVHVPIVPAAILFDLMNGGDKNWKENPYPGLGRQAFLAADKSFSLGTAGAGTGAMAGNVKGGLGSASAVLENGFRIGALVAVNALGSPLVLGQRKFWAAPFEIDAEFGGFGMPDAIDPLFEPVLPKLTDNPGGNTTIAIVATDAALSKSGCLRMATAAQDGMARALVPAHTPFDGDCVFGLSTGSAGPASPSDQLMLGHAASLCLARAIARGIYAARSAEGDPFPSLDEYSPD